MTSSKAHKPSRVVGLRYEIGEDVPQVVLKAVGPQAIDVEGRFVKSRGRQRVVQDAALVDALMRLPVDSTISPDTYELVAALLLHVFAVEGRLKKERLLGSH